MILFCSPMLSQNNISNAVFIGITAGGYLPIFPFDESSSKSGLTYGGGMGVQLFKRYLITWRLVYFSTKGVPLVRYSVGEGNYLAYDGDMEYKHRLSMITLQYKLEREEYFSASMCGGVLFSTVSKTEISIKYDYYSETQFKNIAGGFLGGEIELTLPKHPFSLTGDVQYSYAIGDVIYNSGIKNSEAFSGFNLSIGFRYYLEF
jgi:hypothetical protein